MKYIVLDDIGDFGTFTSKKAAINLAESVSGLVYEFEGEFDWENEHKLTPIYTATNYREWRLYNGR